MRRSFSNQLIRFLVFVVGVFLMSVGVALSVHSGLGTTPISTPPLVLSYIFPVTIGMTTLLLNALLVVLQVIILGRRFQPIQLLQLPAALLFGSFIDLSVFLTSPLVTENYLLRWVLVAGGLLFMGLGIAVQVTARSLVLAGEGFVLAVSDTLNRRFGPNPKFSFGRIKVINDVVHVLVSVVLSLAFLGGFVGVREGTVVVAVLLGGVASRFLKVLEPFGRRLGNS